MNWFTGRLRQQLWERLPQAGILEVGMGTGLNIPYHPPGGRVTAVDISERMLERAHNRSRRLGVAVDLFLMDVQVLGFPDSTFDSAAATFTFCSVPDPVAGLRELRRVLKPGGRLVLLEHVRSENRALGKIMDWLNPLAVRASGANINRRTAENVERAGFEVVGVAGRFRGLVQLIEARRPA